MSVENTTYSSRAQTALATNSVLRNTYMLLSATLLFSATIAGITAAMNLPYPGMIITLVTEKVDEVVAKLGARGLVLEKEPVFNPTFNIYHAFFRDPNGLLVEVQRFEDPQWPKSHSRLSR